jgi:protease IV
MKQFAITFFAVVTGLIAFVIMIPVAGFLLADGPREEVPETLVLTLDLNQALHDAPSNDPISQMLERQSLSVPEIVSALKRASTDERVKGLKIILGSSGIRAAQAQEIRHAIKAFRASSKFAVAFSQQFSATGLGAYYTAAACDEIWLQTTGDMHVTGIAVAAPFLRDTLKKIGVTPQLGRRHEYKSAANTFTETDFTAPHRDSIQTLLASTFDRIAADVSRDRQWQKGSFNEIVDTAPHSATDALSLQLVDRLGYEDEVRASLLKRSGEDAEFITLGRYLNDVGGAYDKGQTVALIYGTGTIVSGQSSRQSGAFSRNVTMGGDTIAQAFRDAADDPDVKAIVFRISSPGGSYVASDQIWREVVRAREAGKPVVATMGSTAASGGYFVAMAADQVLAQAGTVTGSIGVLGGKMVAADLLDKFGVHLREISVGKNATINSGLREYTPEQWQSVNKSLDRVYDDFTGKVAKARGLSDAAVDKAARGRIWTGADALEMGLIDEIGGFDAAIERAKELAEINADAPVRLREYPLSKTLSEQVLALVGGLENVDDAAALVNAVADNPQLQSALAPLTATAAGVLTLPAFYDLP